MIRIIADKIASVTKNIPLQKEIRVSPDIIAESGYVIAGKIHGEKSVYNTVENCSGRMVRLHDGDILVGALGHRNALHGFSGIVPENIKVGDSLNVLNLGGVIGKCTSINSEYGRPFDFEVIGAVQVFPEFGNRIGTAAHIKMNALQPSVPLKDAPKVPIVFIIGTCMNAGKTLAASQIIREISLRDFKVASAKLTGVSLLKDTLSMKDYGADWTATFNDVGIVTTDKNNSVEAAKIVLSYLSQTGADIIVAELGDGIMGQYGVQEIIDDKEIMERSVCNVLCAYDPVGAWGGVGLLKKDFKINVDIISGPATDNSAGLEAIRSKIKVPAVNARSEGKIFGEMIVNVLEKYKKTHK